MTTEEKIEKAKPAVEALLDILKQEHGLEAFVAIGFVDDGAVYPRFVMSDGMNGEDVVYAMAGVADELNGYLETFVEESKKALNVE